MTEPSEANTVIPPELDAALEEAFERLLPPNESHHALAIAKLRTHLADARGADPS